MRADARIVRSVTRARGDHKKQRQCTYYTYGAAYPTRHHIFTAAAEFVECALCRIESTFSFEDLCYDSILRVRANATTGEKNHILMTRRTRKRLDSTRSTTSSR